jgi:membrane protein DedA with SNARE-associated domain
LLCYTGYQLGNNWKNIDKYYSPILDIIAVAVIAGLVVAFIRHTRKKSQTTEEQTHNITRK